MCVCMYVCRQLCCGNINIVVYNVDLFVFFSLVNISLLIIYFIILIDSLLLVRTFDHILIFTNLPTKLLPNHFFTNMFVEVCANMH